MDAEPFIAASSVALSFEGRLALRDVNARIGCGEFVSIVGPSGCGKSTLLRLIAGLLPCTEGSLLVSGQAPTARPVPTSFVFQEPNLLPWRTVTSNIRLPLELGASKPDAKSHERIADALKMIGLTEADAHKRPRQLSGGMKMRVSLARALVTQPELLLLDEPFAALDDLLRQQLNEDLQRLWWDQRWTGLFVTHNVAEAVFLSQRVLVMSPSPGTLLDDISVPFDYPRTPAVRSLPDFARLTGEVSSRLRAAAEGAA